MRAKEDPLQWQKAMRPRCGWCSFSRLSRWQVERTKVRGSETAATPLLNDPPPSEGRGDPRARSDSRRAEHPNSDATRLA